MMTFMCATLGSTGLKFTEIYCLDSAFPNPTSQFDILPTIFRSPLYCFLMV